MSGHKPFKNLSDRLQRTPEGRAHLESQRRITDAIIELAKLREARGATQRQVAEAWEVTQANISQGYLSQLERDEREPTLSIAARLARSLELTLENLAVSYGM